MRIRRIIITHESSFANVEALNQHPNVRRYWRIPARYVLFEFYHPVYERIYDNNPAVSNAAWQNPETRSQAAEAVSQERALLAPLYREVGSASNAGLLLVASRTVMYHFMGRGKGQIQWPFLGRSADWETSDVIRISGRISSIKPDKIKELLLVMRCWEESMRAVGEVIHADELSFSGLSFTLNCRFSGGCGDATMLLFMLLTESRYLISLDAVGFFSLDDSSTPFVEIGGSGRIYQ